MVAKERGIGEQENRVFCMSDAELLRAITHAARSKVPERHYLVDELMREWTRRRSWKYETREKGGLENGK
jgi:hypothetical protein